MRSTAARAASMALFRELFPGELLAPGQLATVSTVTLLVTALDPQQADALYRDLGDARAFSVVHDHLQRLGDSDSRGGRGGGQDDGRRGARVVQSTSPRPLQPRLIWSLGSQGARRRARSAFGSEFTVAQPWPPP